MNGKREKTNAHAAGRVLSYDPLRVHCDACNRDFISWESFGRHVDDIVDKPAATRQEAVMDVLADHLGDIGMEDGWDDPQVTGDGSIKCGCLAEFPDITSWRAHLAQAIIDNIDASKEAYETLNLLVPIIKHAKDDTSLDDIRRALREQIDQTSFQQIDVDATRDTGAMDDEPMEQDWRNKHDRLVAASLIVLDAAKKRDRDGSDVTCAPSNPTAGTTGNMSE